MSHAQQEWGLRAMAEYRSAAISAQLLHWLIQAGLSQELLETAMRVVGDELDHAQLCAQVQEALGGDWRPKPMDISLLAMPQSESLLVSILDNLLPNFLIGETLAVPLFNAMRKNAEQPQAVAALERILRDETVHRSFGWQVLDELMELDPSGVRAHLSERLPGILARLEPEYLEVGEGTLTQRARAAGLIQDSEWGRIYTETLATDILPRLRARGVRIETGSG